VGNEDFNWRERDERSFVSHRGKKKGERKDNQFLGSQEGRLSCRLQRRSFGWIKEAQEKLEEAGLAKEGEGRGWQQAMSKRGEIT